MDTDTCGPFQATPHETLMLELLDCRVPKSEREHAAAREIVTLRAELLATQDQANGQAEVSADYGRRAEDDEFREAYDRAVRPLDYESKIAIMSGAIRQLREAEAERDALRAENEALNEVIEIVRHDSWGQAGVIEKLEARVAELVEAGNRLAFVADCFTDAESECAAWKEVSSQQRPEPPEGE